MPTSEIQPEVVAQADLDVAGGPSISDAPPRL